MISGSGLTPSLLSWDCSWEKTHGVLLVGAVPGGVCTARAETWHAALCLAFWARLFELAGHLGKWGPIYLAEDEQGPAGRGKGDTGTAASLGVGKVLEHGCAVQGLLFWQGFAPREEPACWATLFGRDAALPATWAASMSSLSLRHFVASFTWHCTDF